jgi:exonuclease SbcC
MRPLRLQIKGLRSFRTEAEIDFRELALVAIVGDTGVGKSSILEAITYALYNATTWDQRGVKQLISDGATTMSVQLDFASDDQVYRITRSTSRGQYPPPGHSLESLTDPTFSRLDGEEAIKQEVLHLVGLDWDGFTSAVILPQGRFQTLLQARPAERTEILKGIFRLHQLGILRERAQVLAGEHRGTLDELQAARSQLLPDPATSAREAGARKRAAGKLDKKLRGLKRQITEQDKVAREKTETARRLSAAATLVARANTHPATALEALRPLQTEIDKLTGALAKDEQELQKADERARTALERAEAAGEEEGALTRAQTILARLINESPKLATEERRLEQERRALERDEKQLAGDEASLETLRTTATANARALAVAEQSALDAAGALQHAKEQLADYRRLIGEEGRAADAVARLNAELQKAEEKLEGARLAEATAGEKTATTAAALDELQREHAAAHAAERVRPGDACPICRQTVPAGFTPPRAPAERAAKTAHEKARNAEADVRDVRVKLEERRTQLGGSVQEARTASKAATRAVRPALRRLRTALGDGAADPILSDELLLRALVDRAREQQEASATARAEAEGARSMAGNAEAALQPRRDALNERREALERNTTAQAEHAAAIDAERLALPERFLPVANASVERIQSLLTRLDKRLGEVRDLHRERERLQRRLSELRRDRDELVQRRTREFDEPRRQAEKALLLLHERLRDAVTLAGLEAPTLPEESSDFVAYIEAVAALERSAEKVVDALRAGAGDADDAAGQARDSLPKLLKEAGAPSVEELDDQLIAAAAALSRANDEEAEARAQIPRAAALETKIAPLREGIEALDELAGLLTDGRFIGFVVGRRQRALLGIASQILGSMTGNRYGFAEDFRIIDRISGQPRAARTLSGGETFLASLALALGLVELAARGGGRLEALFLDEGFGSLDADALQDALGELERRAASGRLVAVISHVRAVAEQIETVLRVTHRPEGSKVALISGIEREDFVAEEVEERLLA